MVERGVSEWQGSESDERSGENLLGLAFGAQLLIGSLRSFARQVGNDVEVDRMDVLALQRQVLLFYDKLTERMLK